MNEINQLSILSSLEICGDHIAALASYYQMRCDSFFVVNALHRSLDSHTTFNQKYQWCQAMYVKEGLDIS